MLSNATTNSSAFQTAATEASYTVPNLMPGSEVTFFVTSIIKGSSGGSMGGASSCNVTLVMPCADVPPAPLKLMAAGVDPSVIQVRWIRMCALA